jgi:hypothetical protein
VPRQRIDSWLVSEFLQERVFQQTARKDNSGRNSNEVRSSSFFHKKNLERQSGFRILFRLKTMDSCRLDHRRQQGAVLLDRPFQ